jgi:hypothetical protein
MRERPAIRCAWRAVEVGTWGEEAWWSRTQDQAAAYPTMKRGNRQCEFHFVSPDLAIASRECRGDETVIMFSLLLNILPHHQLC